MDGQNGPLLSLRDLCTLDDLPALCEAGVASLKIEGRLKSAEYVAVVTSVYRRALDAIAKGNFRPGDKAEKEKLLQIFNRGGFTRGHALNAQDADMLTPSRVSHEGLPMGEILSVRREFASMRADRDLHNGDSLQLRGVKDEDMRYSGPDVPAGSVATLRLRPGLRVTPGTAVARLTDARQVEHARAHQPKPIPVSLTARFALGKPMTLSITDGHSSVTVEGPLADAARSRASTAEDARRQLEKLGETPFEAHSVQAIVDENIFLPVSTLNALRRDAAAALEEARIADFAAPPKDRPFDAPVSRPSCSDIHADTLAVIFSDVSLAQPLLDAGATLLLYAPRTFTAEALKQNLPELPKGSWLRLPPQIRQSQLDAILPILEENSGHLGGISAESIGQLRLPVDLPILAGEGVPVTNPEALAQIKAQNVCGFTLWPEWNFAEQKGLLPHSMPCLMKMYGREILMLLNHCPERVRLGLSENRAACRLCKTESMVCGRENASMTDRKGYRFPLSRTRFAHGCEIQALGALPTDLRAHDADRRSLNAGMLLHFTIETPQKQLELTRLFAALLRGETVPASEEQTNTGHWLRGVE